MGLDMFVLGASDLVSSSGLSDIVSFFNTQSTNNDVSGALIDAQLAFKISMAVIMFIGAFAMAIWIGRIGIDILVITLRGIGKGDALAKYGTGNGQASTSVADYFKKNMVEIILVILLVAILMTGWLFRLVALAISGFGMLANKAFNLDVTGGYSKLAGTSFKENVKMMRPTQLKNMYDEEYGAVKTQADVLYDLASKEADTKSDKFVRAKREYTVHLAKAETIAETVRNKASSMNMSKTYFDQHKQAVNGCNRSFFDKTIATHYGQKGFSCATTKAPAK